MTDGSARDPALSILAAVRSDDAVVRRDGFESLVAVYWKPVMKLPSPEVARAGGRRPRRDPGIFRARDREGVLRFLRPGEVAFPDVSQNVPRSLRRQRAQGGGPAQNAAAARSSCRSISKLLKASLVSATSPYRTIWTRCFHAEWIRSSLALAVDDLRAEYRRAGKTTQLAVFERHDLDAPTSGETPSYAKVAREFGVTATDVTNYLAAARKVFRRLLLARLRGFAATRSSKPRRATSSAAVSGDVAVGRRRRASQGRRRLADPPRRSLWRSSRPLRAAAWARFIAATIASLDRAVAIKVLSPTASGPQAFERMRQETRILARLEHPGVVPDLWTSAASRTSARSTVMKLVRGQRLDEHVARRSLAERLRLFVRICEPVAFAHAHAIVHRDLKPDNVMVGEFGEVLVMDWGIAVGHADHVGETPGTIAVRAPTWRPSRREAKWVDARADVHRWARFSTSSRRERPALAIGVERAALAAIVAKARAHQPGSRYPDVVAHGCRRQPLPRRRPGQRQSRDAAGPHRPLHANTARRF